MVDYRVFIFLLSFCFCDDLREIVEYPVTKNPDDSQIERPCGAVYDVNCVREYLYEHSKCKKTYGPVPDPYVRNEMTLYLPLYNLSVTSFNVRVGGLNGRIDEFYVNKETDRLVIAIEFQNLSETIDRSVFRFHRRAREPRITESASIINYSSLLITVVIPNVKDLQLDKAEYTTYLNDFIPPFGVGAQSTLEGVTDPQVIQTSAEFVVLAEINVQELFLSDSTFYPLMYIHHNICDFGLKVL